MLFCLRFVSGELMFEGEQSYSTTLMKLDVQ